MTTRIIGIGACVPDTIVTNNDLTAFLDTNDEWIRERTGIGERRVSTEMGTTALAVEAAKRAMEDAGVSRRNWISSFWPPRRGTTASPARPARCRGSSER